MTDHAEIAVRAAIQSLQGMLQVTSALLHAGREVALDGLEVEAARVCAAIGLLPHETARSMRPDLEALLRDVDSVTLVLRGAAPGHDPPPLPG